MDYTELGPVIPIYTETFSYMLSYAIIRKKAQISVTENKDVIENPKSYINIRVLEIWMQFQQAKAIP